MSIEVEMGDCVILTKSKTSEQIIWTAGIGDCLAIAAQTAHEIMLAHLTSRQYLPSSMGGTDGDPIFGKTKAFLARCSQANIVVATNFRHSEFKLIASPALRLGYDLNCLRIRPGDVPGPVSVDIQHFQIYFSGPDGIHDEANAMNPVFGQNPTQKKKKRAECVIL